MRFMTVNLADKTKQINFLSLLFFLYFNEFNAHHASVQRIRTRKHLNKNKGLTYSLSIFGPRTELFSPNRSKILPCQNFTA